MQAEQEFDIVAELKGGKVFPTVLNGKCRLKVIKDFLEFEALIFYLSEGRYKFYMDVHMNLGKGQFNVERLLSFVPENGYIYVAYLRQLL